MKVNPVKLIIITAIILLVGLYFLFDLNSFITLENLKNYQNNIQDYYINNQFFFIFVFFFGYVLATSLSLPIATILTLMIASLVGFIQALFLVSFASSIGATLAFLISRYLFKDFFKHRYPKLLLRVEQGVAKDEIGYLFAMRVAPVFPFFMINILMGLTKMRVLKYYLVSQVGMLPGTVLYVNAGVQLGSIHQISDILSFKVSLSLIALALFPLMTKKVISRFL